MTIHSVAMQQALEQLRSMRDAVRPPDISPGGTHGPAAPFFQPPAPQPTFMDTMKAAVDSVNDQQRVSRDLQTAYVKGENVSLTDVAIAMQKASVAFEATVQVRNKILESYREIMNMSV